tara:strand:+ start:8779 stop:9348 length:570 start_codon:yes stop_codon:yes gene_type:complete
MTLLFFSLSLLAGLVMLALSLATIWRPQIQFWPPPGTDTWQYKLFWLLFRVFFIGIVVVCILDFGSTGNPNTAQLLLGVPLFVGGFGLAFYVTFLLGWKDAHGEANGLKTSGWFEWSRNPIYVVSIMGIFGLGLVVNSWPAISLLSIWTAFYIAAPFLEEPWLEKQYGDSYKLYKTKVARFVGKRGNGI